MSDKDQLFAAFLSSLAAGANGSGNRLKPTGPEKAYYKILSSINCSDLASIPLDELLRQLKIVHAQREVISTLDPETVPKIDAAFAFVQRVYTAGSLQEVTDILTAPDATFPVDDSSKTLSAFQRAVFAIVVDRVKTLMLSRLPPSALAEREVAPAAGDPDVELSLF
jgi:hypothetical protein